MDLEALGLDLLLPVLVVDLHVVQDGVDEDSNVRVLIREQLKHDGDHLRLVQHHIPGWAEEEELEEGVEYLLHHLVVLLLGAEQVLEQLYQVGLRNRQRALVISADSAHKHDALKQDVVLGVGVDEVIVEEFNHAEVLELLGPQVSWHVHHRAHELQQ